MRTLLGALLVLCAACALPGCSEDKPRRPKMAETSSAFGMEDIEPFLTRLATLMLRGLDDRRVADLTAKIAAQPLDSEETYIYSVVLDGRVTDLTIVAVMDDIDAPDLYFKSHPELIRRIDLLIKDYFAELGR